MRWLTSQTRPFIAETVVLVSLGTLLLTCLVIVVQGGKISALSDRLEKLEKSAKLPPQSVNFTLTVQSPEEAKKVIPLGLQALRVMGDR